MRAQAYIAIPDATPTLMDLVEPNWVTCRIVSQMSCIPSDSPGPSWPNASAQRVGRTADSIGLEPSRMSMRGSGCPGQFPALYGLGYG